MKYGLLMVVFLMLISGCSNSPGPCFEILTEADSIRVGRPVTFDAGCSLDVSDYNWDFGNGLGGYDVVMTTTFDSVKTYKVTLLGTNGSKSSATRKEVVVLP
jgi:hypothetical protein